MICFHGLIRAFAGTISTSFTYPLELIRVRLAYIANSRKGISNTVNSQSVLRITIKEIYQENVKFKPPESLSQLSTSPMKNLRAYMLYHFPILSFYRGLPASLLGRVPYGGTSFLAWGYLHSAFLPPPAPGQPKGKSTPIANLLIGAIAGACGQTVAYPFDIIRRRMQVGGLLNPDPQAWLTLSETVKRVWAERGWRGFYVGMSIGYVKIVPMNAISFAVWQWGKGHLGV